MEKSDKGSQKRSALIRILVLTLVLVASTVIGILHQQTGAAKPVGVDALCPFAAVESFWSLVSGSGFIKRTALSAVVLMGAVVLVTVVFGRAFCGNICPLGFLQEIFDRLGRAIFKKRFEVPQKADSVLRYLKYAVLAGVTFLSWKLVDLVIRPYDPWAAYHHLTSSELFDEFLIGFIVLVVSFAGSLVYNRFFCKYLCPTGALLGIISKISLFKVTRNEESCISCSACDRACPVNINVQNKKRVTSAECLNCNRCADSCPEKDTLYVSFKSKKIPVLAVTLGTLLFMIIPVAATTATGDFAWTIAPLEVHDESFDAEEIKGSHTFKEVSEASGVPKDEIVKKFKLSQEAYNAPIKESAHAEGSTFETEDVREFIKLWREEHR